MLKVVLLALVALVVALSIVPAVNADCQLALTTWYSKEQCDGQSGCQAGLMKVRAPLFSPSALVGNG
jgi:hypothetical protein